MVTDSIGAIAVATAAGERIPLRRLAEISIVAGPSTITREWGYRRITVSCNIRGRDMGSFVAEAQRRVAREVSLPLGRYHVEWGGQFENLIPSHFVSSATRRRPQSSPSCTRPNTAGSRRRANNAQHRTIRSSGIVCKGGKATGKFAGTSGTFLPTQPDCGPP